MPIVTDEKPTPGRRRGRYPKEFRRDAAALVIDQHRTIADVARELVHRCRFATRADARRAIIVWINHYNALRRHSSIGIVSPIEWELRCARRRLQAA